MRHATFGTSSSPAGAGRAAGDAMDGGATDGARAGARAPQPPHLRSRVEAHEEVDRLRVVCERREIAFDRLLEAMLTLRRGTIALREENRELRAELRRLRREAA